MSDHPSSPGFDYAPRTRIVYGINAAERAGELAGELGLKKVLLVTDAGLMAAGHPGRIIRQLEAARISVVLFDKARENPTTRCVENCVAVAKSGAVDGIVG